MKSVPASESEVVDWIIRSGQGDNESFDLLIRHFSARFFDIARKMLRRNLDLKKWEDTDEVFQIAVIRLHTSIAAVKPDSIPRFLGLATTQVRRTLIDLARRHFGPLGDGRNASSDPEAVTNVAAPRSSEPESLAQWAEFHESIDRLSDSEKQIFQLAWYGALTQKEIARLLEISVATVQRRWYSAQISLHQLMEGYSPEESQR